jgi:hypothetical protein
VVVLFSFDIVTNVLISPCIFLLIAYIIWHLPNIFFFGKSEHEYLYLRVKLSSILTNGLLKLLDLSNAFLVEYLLTAISSMPDISTSVLKQKYKTACVAVTQYLHFTWVNLYFIQCNEILSDLSKLKCIYEN